MSDKRHFVVGLLLLAACGEAADMPEEGTGPEDEQAIVGGHQASPHNHPWIVFLRDRGTNRICGGSLIHPKWVLTAAHCVVGPRSLNPGNTTLTFGDHDRTYFDLNVEQQRTVLGDPIVHPNYVIPSGPDDPASDNDLALVELRSAVRITPTVQTIPLGDYLPDSVRIAGWGATDIAPTYEIYPELLQQADVSVVPNSECEGIGPNEFCAGSWFTGWGGRDSCVGDSGGPVIPAYGPAVLVGVVSRGDDLCLGRGVYARIDRYAGWIRETIGL